MLPDFDQKIKRSVCGNSRQGYSFKDGTDWFSQEMQIEELSANSFFENFENWRKFSFECISIFYNAFEFPKKDHM